MYTAIFDGQILFDNLFSDLFSRTRLRFVNEKAFRAFGAAFAHYRPKTCSNISNTATHPKQNNAIKTVTAKEEMTPKKAKLFFGIVVDQF